MIAFEERATALELYEQALRCYAYRKPYLLSAPNFTQTVAREKQVMNETDTCLNDWTLSGSVAPMLKSAWRLQVKGSIKPGKAIEWFFIQQHLARYSARYENTRPAVENRLSVPNSWELEVRIRCMPVLLSEVLFTTTKLAWLREDLLEHSWYLRDRYYARRHLDQSNVMCHLGAFTSHTGGQCMPSAVLHHIASYVCTSPAEKPIPVRLPRFHSPSEVQTALLSLTEQVKERPLSFVRAHLKRILDAIPNEDERPTKKAHLLLSA